VSGVLAHRVDGPADAPVVVLLHAIGTDAMLWSPQWPVWSQAFRVVRIDLPGHGASAPPQGQPVLADYAHQVCEVLDGLHVERAAIVGISLGGMVAQALALRHPSRTWALVLAHTSARTEAPVRDIWDRRLEQFARHGLAAQAPATLERWFTRAFAEASPLTLEWLAAQIRATHPTGYVAAVRAIQGLDHLERLHEIKVPVLVIAGEADSAVPPAAAAAMAERITGARLVVLSGAAHLGNIEQPVAFTEHVGAFLRTHAPSVVSA
jgi:3-oxoadipate enol-lactonase